MIKVNVITNHIKFKKQLGNLEIYLKKKVRKLNTKNIFFKNKNFEFSILLSGNSEIRKYNKKFRKKNKITDVLSFPFYGKKELIKMLRLKKLIYLGDIIINLDMVVDSKYKKNIKLKFDELWLHGLIHLLGGRHKLNKDYEKMYKLETKYFKSIN